MQIRQRKGERLNSTGNYYHRKTTKVFKDSKGVVKQYTKLVKADNSQTVVKPKHYPKNKGKNTRSLSKQFPLSERLPDGRHRFFIKGGLVHDTSPHHDGEPIWVGFLLKGVEDERL
jgi:hypothetical protein